MLLLLSVYLLGIICCMAIICLNYNFALSLVNLYFSGVTWGFLGIFDFINVSVILMLSICFGYACYYTNHYFSNGNDGYQLSYIVMLFVGVMFSLVLSGDFLTTLIFWEYLGVVSYFLILFYMSYLSLRSSVVTLVSSRFGDVCLFLIIAVSIYTGYYMVSCSVLFFFVIFTKSAGFPFISWLLEAMRAPTPVSSLVHSSTLVAAGVWFSMRYDLFTYFNDLSYFYYLLLITIFVTGVCCFYFLDLKKIVALSTCNNISWCLFYLIFGDVVLSLFQLITHGVSKCLLFMLVGDVMSGSGGSQASNSVYSPRFYNNYGVFGLFTTILGLSGAPFIGVFFTKHFLLSSFYNGINIFLLLFTMLCVFLSYFYSFRLCSILINTKSSISSGVLYSFGSGLMVYVWLIINYFIAGSLDEVNALGSVSSASLILFQLVSCITAVYFYSSVWLSRWSSSLFGCDNIVELAYNIFLNLRGVLGIFFFRWDHYSLNLFRSNHSYLINLYEFGLLNSIMYFVLLFLFYWLVLC